jgi:glutamate synthase (NADPH/NADH) small chain
MASKMLTFVSVDREMPEKRTADGRRQDFREIYARFDQDQAATQAGRCSQCGVPFCQVHCPVHNNIPDWLKLAAEGRLEEAYEVSSATNNFPEICGRICPQDRLCEGTCVIEQAGHGTVTIGALERFITDTAWEQGWVKPATPRHERQQSIGIIGAGPAGLAAAEQLRRRGYQIVVYDRHDRVGGLMIYGIPNFKLEKEVVLRRAQLLADAGIRFELKTEIGRDVTLAELRRRHDAVLIACGVYKPREILAPGVGLPGIVPALDYLVASNRAGLGDKIPADGRLDAKGKHVVVIGGGDTAMDCVRTAARQGAKSVKCLYRRDRANMPGSQREVGYAEEEGVEFVYLAQPEAFLGERKLSGVRAQRIHLGLADATGRQAPQLIDGAHFNLTADLAIKALGFDPEDLPAQFDSPDLAVTRWGTLKINYKSMMTNLEGVFAAGDIVRGAALVVWAIRDGRDAAERIETYLSQKAALGLAAE